MADDDALELPGKNPFNRGLRFSLLREIERKRAIEVAKQQAHSIAGTFIQKGVRQNATETDRVLAETARLYLELAEKRPRC